jgi:O-antigen ligase
VEREGYAVHLEEMAISKSRVHWTLVFSALVLATIATFAFPVLASFGFVVALTILFGVVFPAWTLFLYTASLFLFQVPLFASLPVAIPTAAGLLFIAVAFLHRLIMRSCLRLRSILPSLLVMLAIVFLFAALTQPEWTASHPRGIGTYLALCTSAIAVGLVMQRGQTAWVVVKIFVGGTNVISAIAIYETWTGHYNPLGLFEGRDERAYGLADPNYTAALLVTLIPLLVALFLCGRSLITRAWAALSIALVCLTIAMTASRGGVLGMILTGCATFALVSSKQRRRQFGSNIVETNRRFSTGRLSVFAALLVGLAVAAWLAPTVVWDRFSSSDNWTDPRKEARLRIWADYLGQVRESPWWGHGPGYVEEKEELYHNTLLQVLFECGVVGFIAFAVVNGAAFAETVRARKRFAQQGRHELAVLSGATAASLIGFHSTAFFLTSATHKELWFLIGFAASLHHLSLGKQNPEVACKDQT